LLYLSHRTGFEERTPPDDIDNRFSVSIAVQSNRNAGLLLLKKLKSDSSQQSSHHGEPAWPHRV